MTQEDFDNFIQDYLDARYKSTLEILHARIREATELEPVVRLDIQNPWPWEKGN